MMNQAPKQTLCSDPHKWRARNMLTSNISCVKFWSEGQKCTLLVRNLMCVLSPPQPDAKDELPAKNRSGSHSPTSSCGKNPSQPALDEEFPVKQWRGSLAPTVTAEIECCKE